MPTLGARGLVHLHVEPVHDRGAWAPKGPGDLEGAVSSGDRRRRCAVKWAQSFSTPVTNDSASVQRHHMCRSWRYCTVTSLPLFSAACSASISAPCSFWLSTE